MVRIPSAKGERHTACLNCRVCATATSPLLLLRARLIVLDGLLVLLLRGECPSFTSCSRRCRMSRTSCTFCLLGVVSASLLTAASRTGSVARTPAADGHHRVVLDPVSRRRERRFGGFSFNSVASGRPLTLLEAHPRLPRFCGAKLGEELRVCVVVGARACARNALHTRGASTAACPTEVLPPCPRLPYLVVPVRAHRLLVPRHPLAHRLPPR